MNNRALDWVLGVMGAVLLPAGLFILLAFGTILVDSMFGIFTIRKRGDIFSLKKLIFNGILVKFLFYGSILTLLYHIDDKLVDSVIHQNNLITKAGTLFILTNELGSIWKHFSIMMHFDTNKNTTGLTKALDLIREILRMLTIKK